MSLELNYRRDLRIECDNLAKIAAVWLTAIGASDIMIIAVVVLSSPFRGLGFSAWLSRLPSLLVMTPTAIIFLYTSSHLRNHSRRGLLLALWISLANILLALASCTVLGRRALGASLVPGSEAFGDLVGLVAVAAVVLAVFTPVTILLIRIRKRDRRLQRESPVSS
jgi:hypothetical protein